MISRDSECYVTRDYPGINADTFEDYTLTAGEIVTVRFTMPPSYLVITEGGQEVWVAGSAITDSVLKALASVAD